MRKTCLHSITVFALVSLIAWKGDAAGAADIFRKKHARPKTSEPCPFLGSGELVYRRRARRWGRSEPYATGRPDALQGIPSTFTRNRIWDHSSRVR